MHETEGGHPPWRHLAGLGFELFGMLLGSVLLGTWIDRSYDTSPRGVLICAILGIGGGLYKLIQSALSTLNPPAVAGKTQKSGDSRDDEVKDRPASSREDSRND